MNNTQRILALALAIVLWCASVFGSDRDYPITVVRVKDGDTAVFFVDLDFETYRELTVRCERIQCAELKNTGGNECRKTAEEWLLSSKSLRLIKKGYDPYHRVVGKVINERGEEWADVMLTKQPQYTTLWKNAR